MKNRHNFEFSPKTMLILLTVLCILLLSVSTVLKDVVKPLSTVAETVVIPMQDGINSFGVWVGEHVGSFKSMKELKKENAKLNGLDNCSFIAGDVFEVLEKLEQKPDVIVVDPPRVGIQPKALDKILGYGVKQIVYISCNTKSLTDNLMYIQGNGYEVKKIKAFDNFPMTKHVETVVLLSQLK